MGVSVVVVKIIVHRVDDTPRTRGSSGPHNKAARRDLLEGVRLISDSMKEAKAELEVVTTNANLFL